MPIYAFAVGYTLASSWSGAMARLSEVVAGAVFGRLTVLSTEKRLASNGRMISFASCKCNCGKYGEYRSECLGTNTGSCGCLHIDKITKHNVSKTHPRIYYIWHNMLSRCQNAKHHAYSNYGGRGITVCEAWGNSVEAFRDWCFESGYSEMLTLDRIDNDKCYEPSNCRWVSHAEQQGNRQNRQMYAAWGETKSASDWLKDDRCTTKDRRLIRRRVFVQGMTPEQAMTEPARRLI